MAADITSAMKYHPMAGFSVSLSGDNAGALRGYWEKPSTGGTTTMPMQKQIRGDGVRHVRRQVRRLVAGRHQPAAGLATRPGARPPHLARRRRGGAGSAGDRHNAGQTPTSGVLGRPPAPSRPGHRSPRPALRHARAPQFARPGSVMDVRLRKMDPRSSDPPSGRPSTEATGRPSSSCCKAPPVTMTPSSWQATADPFQPAPPERGTMRGTGAGGKRRHRGDWSTCR